MASMENGQNRDQEKCPASTNCTVAIYATKILSDKAVGLITAGATLSSDMTAMYPDAPAWPIDEYRTVIRKIPLNRGMSCSVAIAQTLDSVCVASHRRRPYR